MGKSKDAFFVVTCEHASQDVPRRYEAFFEDPRAQLALESHRGVDFGAATIARVFAERLDAPYFEGTMTRLLIDLNRSPRHPRLFSEFSRGLSEEERAELSSYHQDYRSALLERLRGRPEGTLVHLSVHSFTPVFEGVERRTDFGVLYDPKRVGERKLGQRMKLAFAESTGLVAHANQPYRGVSDGVATWLRKELGERYLGFELEFSQRQVGPRCPPARARTFVECLALALGR